MQIIQSIRDKGAAIVIVIIALSLIGFILMDAKQGGGSLFSSLSSNVGKVNGESIDHADFNKRVKQAEDMQQQRGSAPPTSQIREQMWNQMVAEKIFFAETGKLGINLTSSELRDILLSNDQGNPFLREQAMLDSATGKLDVTKAQQAIANIKKFTGDKRDAVDAQIIDPLTLTSNITKYTGLLNASVYYPSWMQQKETTESKNFAVISYVNLPYSEIIDSTIKVSDADVNEYVQKHKDLFKQEEGRNISYISFSQLASKEDSTRISAYVEGLKNSFAADSNAKVFVARNTSAIDYSDEFVPKSKLATQIADTITKLPIGSVYGPYQDKNNFVIAKLVAIKQLPDSVHARHILLPVQDQQTGRVIMEDSVAKKLADSILAAINTGADFAALALQYSSDGSKTKGGDLGTYEFGKMVPEFNAFSFSKPIGAKDVVRTQFGYHVIEILGQKDFKPAYNMAYIGKEILASEETISKAQLEATKASNEKNAANLAKYISNKAGLKLVPVTTMIKENDYAVGEFQEARSLVRWVFEAKKGDISEPFSFGEQFIVAQVDKINNKGVMDAAAARSGCEQIIRNQKKAEIIIKKIGANATLESVAAANNKQVQQAGLDSSITMTSQIINGLGLESKVIGAAFNKEYQTKVSPPIEGTTGVYLIKVNSVQSKPADAPESITTKAETRKTALRSQVNGWYEGLRKKADIKDSRSKFY